MQYSRDPCWTRVFRVRVLDGRAMRKAIARFGDEDVANELLRDFRVGSSVLCRSVMAPPWGFGVANRDRGSFHMVLEGRGWLEVEGTDSPLEIEAGDLAVLPRG